MHVAIFSVSLPTAINPILSLVRVFVRRGVRVTFITSRKYVDEVTELGAHPIIVPWVKMPIDDQKGTFIRDEEFAHDLFDANCRMIDIAKDHLMRDRPDVILYVEAAFAGVVVANAIGVEAIRVTPQLIFDEEGWDHLGVPQAERAFDRTRGALIREFMARHGAPRDNVLFARDEPTIYLYPRELQIGRTENNSAIYAARCAAERPCREKWTAPTDDRSAILISASTTYTQKARYYTDVLAALSGRDLRVIISGRYGVDSLDDSSLPSGCNIIREVPQILLLPYVRLLVCQPGMTTVTEAAYHGCPLVMLSLGMPELEWLADNAASHGLGLHVRGARVPVDELSMAIASVLEDKTIDSATRRIRDVVRRSAGAEEVANWIENFLCWG